MVMEAPPSPQSVGREFVRQYYTLLNKAPTHLHRFYNNQSSFVHGGLDPPNHETSPMIGQKQIHQKIQQLNFRDCHAKITQVDAQATLGNGVVVQVTGELSNAGQPMRRFTQTFVLAAQSPKKYYVHNDIFRYQDEIVFDDGCDADRSETEDEMVQERPIMNEVLPITQQTMSYYNPNPASLQQTMSSVPIHHGQPTANMSHVISSPPLATVNGSAHPDDINNIIPGTPLQQHVQPMQPPTISPMGNMQPGLSPLSPLMPMEDNQQLLDDSPIESALDDNYNMPEDNIDMQEMNQDSGMSNEPKTYATLLKSSTGSPYSNLPPMTNTYNTSQKSLSPPLQQNRYDNRDSSLPPSHTGNQIPGPGRQQRGSMEGNRGPRINNQPPPRPPRQESRTASGKNSFSEEGITAYDDRKKPQSYGNTAFMGGGDTNQLFLGNLPHIATEDELREIFGPYGTIIDLRIHSKTGIKGGSVGPRGPPNYGFLTFDNHQAIQDCLAARPIHYPYNDKDGIILNVEEKRTRMGMSYGGGGGFGNRVGLDNGGPRNRDNRDSRDNGPPPRRGPGPIRNNGGPPAGGGGGSTTRPNNFNRPPPNRSSNNTFNNRR